MYGWIREISLDYVLVACRSDLVSTVMASGFASMIQVAIGLGVVNWYRSSRTLALGWFGFGHRTTAVS